MQFEQVSPDLLVAEKPRSAARWFGLPFALAGFLPLAGAFGLVHIENESGGTASPLILVPFGLVFLCIGFGLILHRSGFTIDRAAGTVTKWHRIVFPIYRKTRATKAYVEVTHTKEVVRSDKSSRTIYPVELAPKSGRGFRILSCSDFRSARRTAEAVAKALTLPVVDHTDGTGRRREADELDLSLRDRRQKQGDLPELAAPPPDMRSRVTPQGDTIDIEIPGFGMTPLHFLGLAAATGPIWLMTIFLTVTGSDVPGFFRAAVLAMGILPAAVAVIAILAHASRRWNVQVSSRELRIESRGLRRSVTTIPADELEELTVPEESGRARLGKFLGGGPPITAISDHALVNFGQSLKARESSYLAQVIGGVISAPAK